MNESFRPHERIRKRKDFSYIYRKGSRYRGKYFILICLSNELRYSRMAVVASKKTGNAVVRNRIKRRIRALFRTHKHLLTVSLDMVFIVRREIRNAARKEIRGEYIKALEAVKRP